MTKAFVGFNSLEKLLAAVDLSMPVNAVAITDPGHGNGTGISLCTNEIVVSQVKGDEVLYCTIVTGRYQAFAGDTKPIHDPEGRFQKLAESAWNVVKDFLKDCDIEMRQTLVAIPDNLKMLDGDAECLHYNKSAEIYERI